MAKRLSWGAWPSVLLLLGGTSPAKAVEYGELAQTNAYACGSTAPGISEKRTTEIPCGTWSFKSTEDPVFKYMRDTGWITNERYYQVSEQTGKNWIEPPDAILNRRKDIDWNRYLKTGLHLPDWIDLGLENRTRFESYDHPWRAAQKAGNVATDAQIPLRSRLRVGLGGDGPLRFLFEGQDSRSVILDNNPRAAFRDTTMVDEFDVLQLFGAVKVDNFLDTGLRTDVLFGRFTMDLGNRRMVARNDFRNTVNAFDGFLWQLSQANTWKLRTFATETVQRDESSLDTDNNKSLFWGTYLEHQQFRWFNLDAYYLGLNDRRVATVTSHRTYSTFSSRLYKDPKPGELDYEIETTWQIGHKGVTKHFAHFQHLDVGYMFNYPWTPLWREQWNMLANVNVSREREGARKEEVYRWLVSYGADMRASPLQSPPRPVRCALNFFGPIRLHGLHRASRLTEISRYLLSPLTTCSFSIRTENM